METESSLLQRYHSDRRKLLEFLLSSGLIKEVRTPSGPATSTSNINLDFLSADYVLQCLQSGGVLDLSEANKRFRDECDYPVMSQLGDSYFLLSSTEFSGSPPRRMPPEVKFPGNHGPHSFILPHHLSNHKVSVEEFIVNSPAATSSVTSHFSLGLPVPSTADNGFRIFKGLSDDDLRESAYEILLACLVFSGRIELHCFEDRKREKSSKFLAGLKNKRDKRHLQSRMLDRHLELIDTIRIQMQISETMDTCLRKRLMEFASRQACEQVDVPQLSLGLLNGLVKSDFLNEKWYMQWKKRQVNILEEFLSSAKRNMTGQQTIGALLAKIRNSEEWDSMVSPHERSEVLLSIKKFAFALSSIPGRYGIRGETFYWTSCYQLNIRLYDKLLFCVFDILEENQLIEEADEILKIVQLTWPTLGITQKLHNVLYGWVLFQQFTETKEAILLDHAIIEVKKALSAEDANEKEEQYMNSLTCFTPYNGTEMELSLVQAIFSSICNWSDDKLQDYHLHLSQKPCLFRRVMTMSLTVGISTLDKIKVTESTSVSEIASRKVRTYVERSIEAACKRAIDTIGLGSKLEKKHPLAVLAGEVKQIAEKELNAFLPVLCEWCPEAGRISATLLHQHFGERLRPYLQEVSCLSEDARVVLPAADALEHFLVQLYDNACDESRMHYNFNQEFDHYQIGEISGPIILDWVISQHEHIIEWTGRVFDLEDWGPLSYHQKQAASAVEVFRITEETVEQFFGLNLPMDITHLQALLSIIFHTLDAYLLKVVSQLVEKSHLYPCAPPLTRYTETAFPIARKKLVECVLLEEEKKNKLSELTISKLCIRLNTLQYIQKQIQTLEESIRNSWASVKPSNIYEYTKGKSPETLDEDVDVCRESVDELFVATFDCIRATAANAIRKICDFTGTKVVFWDLRDSFLFRLYHGSVESSRLETILPHFDNVLNDICGLIDDALRDLLVSNICKASLEGYVWVLLDGGPARAFSDLDVVMMTDDLNMLKDLFVADGEGLPRSRVEEESKFASQVLSLFSLQSESLIQMLMTASENISNGLDSQRHSPLFLGEAHTLVRVLCHKKDRDASKFLKKQYQLPASSEYEDMPLEDPSLKSPFVAELLKRSTSFRWSEKGHSSFRSLKKRLQEATSEIKYPAW